MKAKFFSVLAAMAMVGLVYAVPSHAQDKAADKTEHDSHHPEATTPAAKDAGMMGNKGGMMGNMDMNQMMGMMHECMEMHKDGKMCDHDMMEKCQGQMSKGDCQKMMKQAKAQDQPAKKK